MSRTSPSNNARFSSSGVAIFMEDCYRRDWLPDGYASAWAQYSVLLKDKAQRDRAMEHLKMAGIPCMIYYAKPLHLQGALAYLEHARGDFPVSEEVSDRIISLPMHPYLSPDDQDRIVSSLTEFLIAES